MADWYDEDMPEQECPYTRDNRIAMENYFEGLNYKASKYEPTATPETVIIQGANGKVWTRVLSDWYRSFKLIEL